MTKLHIQKEVRENFQHYHSLKTTSKRFTSSIISLEDRDNHKGRSIGSVPLQCTISQDIVLFVEASKNFINDFQFKIIDRPFMGRPCFRFDSSGIAHINIIDVPLSEREVKTPHFHEFNMDGIEIAYKTDILNKNEQLFLKNPELALAYFFQEENISFQKSPEMFIAGQLIPPENKEFDPLEGEDFHE